MSSPTKGNRTNSAVSRIQVSPSKTAANTSTVSPAMEDNSPSKKSRAIGAGWYIEPANPVRKTEAPESTASSLSSSAAAAAAVVEDKGGNPSEDRTPFFFIRWIANRPRLCFGVALGMHIFFLVLSGVLVVSGYDLIPANWESLPLELHDEPWLKREYAWLDRDEYSGSVNRVLPANKYPTWQRAFTKQGVLLFYDAGGGNIFTKDKLQVIETIEQRLVSVNQFSTYCQMTQSGTCKPPISVLRFFDGTYASVDAVFNDPNFNNIDNVLYAAYTYNETKSAFAFALGKNNQVSSGSVTCTLTRTLVPLGWPLSGYSDEKSMDNALTEFMAEYMEPVLSDSLEVSAFDFTFYNNALMFYQVRQQAMYDMALALGSMIFIFLFIWFHTRSLFVTCLAELSIVCSFVETNFIYRVVIGFNYFGYFHVLAMFIILGIGADDLFVFWDAWKATGLQSHPSLAHRLNEAYRKSVISMLVTSLTTMAAFLSNAVSPLLATRSFGVFAAILVGIDYLSVITFFPTIIVFYHLHFEDKPHPCCCCWKKKKKEGEEGDGEDSEENVSPANKYATETGHTTPIATISHTNKNSVTTFHGQSPNHTSPARLTHQNSSLSHGLGGRSDSEVQDGRGPGSKAAGRQQKEEPATETKPSRLVIFFRDYYFAFVTHKVVRWVIVLLLLGCLAGFAYSATKLEPDNEQIQLYTDSHHYSRAIKHNNYGFVSSDQDRTITIILVWGLKENDLSSCHFSSVECRGDHRFDDSFQASTLAAQRAFVRICDTMFNFTAEEVSEYAIRRDLVTGQPEIACFPRNMDTFLQSDPVSGSVDVTMPWDWTKTSAFMTSLSTHYDNSAFNSSFTHFLDIPLTYWIWDAFQQNNTEDYQIFNSLFGEETDTYTSGVLTAPSILVGNKIKYMAIAVNTTLRLQSLGYTEGIPIVQRWEQFMTEQLRTMPAEMQSGFQTTFLAWHWLYVQRALADNAILGIAVGLSLAFPVLVLSTCNVINGLLATLSICCVTTCVIGVIPLGGWKLGVLVSLNMCLVVGLAVDFVVHLAEGYHMSHRTDRRGRLQQALERMGISVFSGACTTLGASSFMLFAKIQFFFQFGIFMFCTIGFSLVFSMGLYVTVMGILGPQGNIGDIRVFFRKCCARIRPSEDTGSTPGQKRMENGVSPAMNGSLHQSPRR
ncbi:protein dispatched homolog 1-like [Babylonia areolata]|uniref:protein dispatched homolog 1-like n=1 Tax=Babylonia areolata TaxID=304850 RepID=UPI003FD2B6F0